jgi:hypothetical protein
MAALEDRARVLRALVGYLAALVGREREGLLEVRWRHGGGMRRRVFRVADQLPAAAAQIVELGARTDVYVGVAPRRRRPGGHGALARVWVLWVDCDTPAAVQALGCFSPAPTIVIRSGIIRSARMQRGCRWAVRCWRHVVSETDWMPRGGGRDGR